MTWKPVLVLLVSSALVAACSASSGSSGSGSQGSAASVDSPPVAQARALSSVNLDDGALVVEPLPVATPVVTRAQAARVLAGSGQGDGALTPVVAHVVIDVPVGHAPAGTPAHLDLATAWVYTFPERAGTGTVSCTSFHLPMHFQSPSPSPSGPADPSDSYAVVVDGSTGRGYVYAGAGTGYCGPRTVPDILSIGLRYSVPYTVHWAKPGSARITAALPPCAAFEAFTPSFTTPDGRRGSAVADVPTGQCAGGGTTFVESINGRFTESPHSAVGLMCSGAYDADLGRPADCVPNA